MHEILVAGAIFVCLVVAALGCLVLSARLRSTIVMTIPTTSYGSPRTSSW